VEGNAHKSESLLLSGYFFVIAAQEPIIIIILLFRAKQTYAWLQVIYTLSFCKCRWIVNSAFGQNQLFSLPESITLCANSLYQEQSKNL
jgi:hypothetical protein